MILPIQSDPSIRRVRTPEGTFCLETTQPPGLRLLERQSGGSSEETLLDLPSMTWEGPMHYSHGRFTFTLVYNGRRVAIRLHPARRTFVFQPTDAAEPFAVLRVRLEKLFGKPRPGTARPLAASAAVDWTVPPPRPALILQGALGALNFLLGCVVIYIPSRPGWTPRELLTAGVFLLTGGFAQLLAFPLLFPARHQPSPAV